MPPPSLPPLNTSASPVYPSSNSTYFTDDEEQDESGFSDVETVALACFLTLLPLIFGLVSYFGFRHCWVRCKRTVEPTDFAKVIDKACADRSKSSHALLTEQMKSSESQMSVGTCEEVEEANLTLSKSTANGSIITMTMKNNHLIVETEERLEEGTVSGGGLGLAAGAEDLKEVAVIQVEPILTFQMPFCTTAFVGANIGLSTSNLSSCSDSSGNRNYRYGTQEEYTDEQMEGGPATLAAIQPHETIAFSSEVT